MDIFRFIGIIIVSGIPAIIGGGLFFAIFESWIAVAVWEILLIFGATITAYPNTTLTGGECNPLPTRKKTKKGSIPCGMSPFYLLYV